MLRLLYTIKFLQNGIRIFACRGKKRLLIKYGQLTVQKYTVIGFFSALLSPLYSAFTVLLHVFTKGSGRKKHAINSIFRLRLHEHNRTVFYITLCTLVCYIFFSCYCLMWFEFFPFFFHFGFLTGFFLWRFWVFSYGFLSGFCGFLPLRGGSALF